MGTRRCGSLGLRSERAKNTTFRRCTDYVTSLMRSTCNSLPTMYRILFRSPAIEPLKVSAKTPAVSSDERPQRKRQTHLRRVVVVMSKNCKRPIARLVVVALVDRNGTASAPGGPLLSLLLLQASATPTPGPSLGRDVAIAFSDVVLDIDRNGRGIRQELEIGSVERRASRRRCLHRRSQRVVHACIRSRRRRLARHGRDPTRRCRRIGRRCRDR